MPHNSNKKIAKSKTIKKFKAGNLKNPRTGAPVFSSKRAYAIAAAAKKKK